MRGGERSSGGVPEQDRQGDETHRHEAADGPLRREHDFPQRAGKDERTERRGDPPVQHHDGEQRWVLIGDPGFSALTDYVKSARSTCGISRSDPTTLWARLRACSDGGCRSGTIIARIPARSAARMPAFESSTTTHRDGGYAKRRAAARKMSGAGFPADASSRVTTCDIESRNPARVRRSSVRHRSLPVATATDRPSVRSQRSSS